MGGVSAREWSQGYEDDGTGEIGQDLYACLSSLFLVLFLFAVVAMGRPEITLSELNEAQAAARQAGEERDAAKKQGEQVREQLEEAVGKLSPQALEVVIALDGTSSMKGEIDKVRTCVETLAEVGARIAPSFKIGIVIYRATNTVFPMTEIDPTKDGKKSEGMRALYAFANDKTEVMTLHEPTHGEVLGKATGETLICPKLTTFISIAKVDQGIARALRMFSKPTKDKRRLLIVIGDMGCFEESKPNSVEASEWEKAREVYAWIRGFAAQDNSRVLSLFSGSETADLDNREESRKFFRELARAAGPTGTYSEEANQLAAVVMSASVEGGVP